MFSSLCLSVRSVPQVLSRPQSSLSSVYTVNPASNSLIGTKRSSPPSLFSAVHALQCPEGSRKQALPHVRQPGIPYEPQSLRTKRKASTVKRNRPSRDRFVTEKARSKVAFHVNETGNFQTQTHHRPAKDMVETGPNNPNMQKCMAVP